MHILPVRLRRPGNQVLNLVHSWKNVVRTVESLCTKAYSLRACSWFVLTAASAARLVFESYEPSKAEKEWGVYLRTHDVKQSLCPALIAPPFHGWISTWLNGTTEAKDYIIDVNAAPPDFLSMMKAIGLQDTEEVFSVLRKLDTRCCLLRLTFSYLIV